MRATRILLATTFLAATLGAGKHAKALTTSSRGFCSGPEMEALNSIRLTPVANGKILTDHPVINAGQLWSERPALVYVVRRPG